MKAAVCGTFGKPLVIEVLALDSLISGRYRLDQINETVGPVR